ncbi:MAG: glycosyltransferase family 2 protein [Arenimonas sp.]
MITTSIIISTYNKPDWLMKTLIGYAHQNFKDFELILADDGSTSDTKQCVDEIRSLFKHPIIHLWQEDNGFRKCEILNKAILASDSDYVIFSDGDCIPRADFVETHLKLRAPGLFLSGGYHKLPIALSQKINDEDIAQGKCFDLNWLKIEGLRPSIRNLKISPSPFSADLLDRFSTAHASWNGHNASGWKADIVAVNGFDQRMEYGGLDREFGERLENAGIKGLRIRYRAICLHLDHSRDYARPEKIAANKKIRQQTKLNRSTWTDYGISTLVQSAGKAEIYSGL